MALWDPSGLNNNRVSLAFSNMLWNEIVSILSRKYGFWFAIQGKNDIGNFEFKDGRLTFPSIDEITGYKMEVSFRGKQASPSKIGFGSPEVQLRGTNYESNIWGGFQFDLCHYLYHQDIPISEYEMLRGNEVKTESALEAYRDYIAEGYDELIANDVHGNTNQSQTSILGLPFLVSTTSAYAFDRTDSAHAKFRSQVDDASSVPLTKHMLGVNQKKCYDAGAEELFGLTNIENYQDIVDLTEDKIRTTGNGMFSGWENKFVEYAGVPYVMDNRSAASTVYHIDPTQWKIIKNMTPLNTTGIVLNPATDASYILMTHLWLGLACRRPHCQGKIESLG